MASVKLSHALLTDPRLSNGDVADLVSAAVDTAGFTGVPADAVVPGDSGPARTVLVRPITDRDASLRLDASRAPVLVVVLDGRVESVPLTEDGGVGHELLGQGQVRMVPAGSGVALRLSESCPSARFCAVWLGEVTGADPISLVEGSDGPPYLPDYYYGYDERYEAVYAAGGATWETPEPNEALVHALDKLGVTGGRVVDLGCGEGRDSVHLASRGFDVVAVDVSRAALDKGREAAAAAGVSVTFLERDVTTLVHLPEGPYDLAVNMGCLHMMPDPSLREAHLRRVHEILSADGLFLIAHCRERWLDGFYSVPDYESVGEVVPGRVIPRRVRMRDGGTAMLPLPLVPYKESPTQELRSEVEAAGFRLVADLSARTEAFGNTSVLAFSPAPDGKA